MFKQHVVINKEFVTSRVSEEEIFERYLGLPVNTNTFYKNTKREDESPGCKYYYSKKTGRIRFRDFSKEWDWDCFDVVQREYKCSFKQALKIVAVDFNLIGVPTKNDFVDSPTPVEDISKIEIASKPFTKEELEYWKQFYLTEEQLKRNYIYSVKFAKRGDRVLFKGGEMCFAYYLGNKEYNLYFPNRRYARFMKTDMSIVQGWYLIPNTGNDLIITKSYKDVVCLIENLNIPAVAPQSETILWESDVMDKLSKRFIRIWCLFDNDQDGRRATRKYISRYPYIRPLLFPFTMKKDYTDNLKALGLERMREIAEHVRKAVKETPHRPFVF